MSFEESCKIKKGLIDELSKHMYYPLIDNDEKTILKRKQLNSQLEKENKMQQFIV